MLNRNAARHLLLVASILLCAFIYAGYSLATRGDPAPSDPSGAAGSAAAGGGGLRPSASGSGDIPAADGDELSLAPPVAPSSSSMRPLSPPPPAASGSDAEGISGLVPDASEDSAASVSPGMAGTSLPLPGFGDAAPETGESAGGEQAAPVLALPGMDAPADGGEEDFEDFGEFVEGDAPAAGSGGDGGDFAALPGFEEPPAGQDAPSGAAMLPPPPSGGNAAPPSSPAPAPRTATFAPPPPAGTGTALRPPPPPRGDEGNADETEMRPLSAPPPARPRPAPIPASTAASASAGAPPPSLEPFAGGDPEPRSDSLRIYVVAPGDTLSSIAMRELGSGFLADNIFLLNRDVIDDPNHLMAGAKIRLPYANPGASDPAAAAGGYGDAARRPTQGLGSTHVVARGDTLSSIALRYYGSSAAWRFLYEANKTTVPNPNQLTVGTELSVPPYEE